MLNAGWVRDLDAPRGWRYEFEAQTYQMIKALFAAWFEQPLEPLPRS
jgi:hypothetical protein